MSLKVIREAFNAMIAASYDGEYQIKDLEEIENMKEMESDGTPFFILEYHPASENIISEGTSHGCEDEIVGELTVHFLSPHELGLMAQLEKVEAFRDLFKVGRVPNLKRLHILKRTVATSVGDDAIGVAGAYRDHCFTIDYNY